MNLIRKYALATINIGIIIYFFTTSLYEEIDVFWLRLIFCMFVLLLYNIYSLFISLILFRKEKAKLPAEILYSILLVLPVILLFMILRSYYS